MVVNFLIMVALFVSCFEELLHLFISFQVGKGYVRVLKIDKSKRIELIPVDVTANAHIVGAFQQASKRFLI